MRTDHVLVVMMLAMALLAPTNAIAKSKCTSRKYKAAGKAALAKAKCQAAAAAKGRAVDAGCLARADQKLTQRWTHAEAKGDCVTTGDLPATKSALDAFEAALPYTLEPTADASLCCATADGCYHGVGTAANCELLVGTVGAPGTACDSLTGNCRLPPVTTGKCCHVPTAESCIAGPDVDLAGCVNAGGNHYPFGAKCLPNGTCDALVP